MTCPRCGEAVAAGQEYCLECGLRLPGRERRLGRARRSEESRRPARRGRHRRNRRRGTRDRAHARCVGPGRNRHGTGGSLTVTRRRCRSGDPSRDLAGGTAGWTNVLVSIPKVEGRDAAVARAEQARRRGLAPRRRARLVPLREPPPRLLGRVRGRLYSAARGGERSASCQGAHKKQPVRQRVTPLIRCSV